MGCFKGVATYVNHADTCVFVAERGNISRVWPRFEMNGTFWKSKKRLVGFINNAFVSRGGLKRVLLQLEELKELIQRRREEKKRELDHEEWVAKQKRELVALRLQRAIQHGDAKPADPQEEPAEPYTPDSGLPCIGTTPLASQRQ